MDTTIIYFIVICIISGVFSGLTSGLLGLGGGLVIVPVLNYVLPLTFNVDPQYILPISIQTSFALIVFNTATASYKQLKLNNVSKKAVLVVAPTLIISSAIVGHYVTGINPGYLKILFACVVIYSALRMVFKRAAQQEQGGAEEISTDKGMLAGTLIGGISATAGISGGAFLSPFFNGICKFPIKKALGTSSACGFFLAVSGTLTYLYSGMHIDTGIPYTFGYLNIIAFISMFFTSVYFASYGVKLQHILPPAKVSRIFGLFLLLIAADFIYSACKSLGVI